MLLSLVNIGADVREIQQREFLEASPIVVQYRCLIWTNTTKIMAPAFIIVLFIN
jgi:hypothetical protein